MSRHRRQRVSPTSSANVVHHLATARVADRNALFAALGDAVRPSSPPSVLAVFGFNGLTEYVELVSQHAGDVLLEWFGQRILWVIGDAGTVLPHTSFRVLGAA